MGTVLLVEDDRALAAQLRDHVEGMGHEVLAWTVGRRIDPTMPPDVDLVVLDLMLPERSGFEVLADLRAASDVPVLVLSARDGSDDKVKALRLGADDYLTKPFWPEEFVERVRARLRRPVLARSDVVSVGALTVDRARREVQVGGEPVDLAPAEYRILDALLRRPGAALTRRALAEHALDPDRGGGDRALDAHVSRLRAKLGKGVVETVWGVGYRLAEAPAP